MMKTIWGKVSLNVYKWINKLIEINGEFVSSWIAQHPIISMVILFVVVLPIGALLHFAILWIIPISILWICALSVWEHYFLKDIDKSDFLARFQKFNSIAKYDGYVLNEEILCIYRISPLYLFFLLFLFVMPAFPACIAAFYYGGNFLIYAIVYYAFVIPIFLWVTSLELLKTIFAFLVPYGSVIFLLTKENILEIANKVAGKLLRVFPTFDYYYTLFDPQFAEVYVVSYFVMGLFLIFFLLASIPFTVLMCFFIDKRFGIFDLFLTSNHLIGSKNFPFGKEIYIDLSDIVAANIEYGFTGQAITVREKDGHITKLTPTKSAYELRNKINSLIEAKSWEAKD